MNVQGRGYKMISQARISMSLLVEKKQMLLYSDSTCSNAHTAAKQRQDLQTGLGQTMQQSSWCRYANVSASVTDQARSGWFSAPSCALLCHVQRTGWSHNALHSLVLTVHGTTTNTQLACTYSHAWVCTFVFCHLLLLFLAVSRHSCWQTSRQNALGHVKLVMAMKSLHYENNS